MNDMTLTVVLNCPCGNRITAGVPGVELPAEFTCSKCKKEYVFTTRDEIEKQSDGGWKRSNYDSPD